ncbi:male-specific opa-containing protein [Drosophila sechellia]|uniref:GM22431 n=1 Tax=Drosophila sechellia TaxID=7238 RepID=B4IAY8_DROSE|nr:male-specific opa-containing protein [Drosophila sechellia]EDW44451.1 GM22431 [Drosophila sechellia]
MNFLQIGVLFVLVAVTLARPQEDPASLPAPEAAAEAPSAAAPPPAAAPPAGGSGRKKNVNHNVITIG